MPVVQLVPLLVLYCQVAPVSIPETLTWPLLVMPSLPLDPVSEASAKVGAAGAVRSTTIAAGFDHGVPGFPARSVCRTRMLPMA